MGYRTGRWTSEAIPLGIGRSRMDDAPTAQAVRRAPRCGFRLGNSGSCATLVLQPACTGEERTLSATHGLPRIGGPLSTARSISTVLRAPSPPRVRAFVCPSPLADHILAAGGHLFAVGNWSFPMWRFHFPPPSETIRHKPYAIRQIPADHMPYAIRDKPYAACHL